MARVSQTNVQDKGRSAAAEVKKVTDEEGEGVGGDGEAGTADWKVRAGPRNKTIARERLEHEATYTPFRDWCTQCMMGRGRTNHHVSEEKK